MPHMHDRYERVFAPRVLLAINIAIIVSAQLVGGGRAFYDQGLIYFPSFLFLALVCARILTRFSSYDAALQKFLSVVMASLAMLGTAQLIDLGTHLPSFSLPRGGAFGSIVSLQLAALLTFAFGTFYVLRSYGKLREAMPWIVVSSLVGIIAFSAALASFLGHVSNVPPMLYMGLAAITGMSVAVPFHRIERILPFLEEFTRHMTAAAVFIALSVAINTLQLINGAMISDRQATYGAHFAFFAAMSFLFLGIGRLTNMGEEYKKLSTFAKKRE